MATRGWVTASARIIEQPIQVSLSKNNSFCFFQSDFCCDVWHFRFIGEQWNGDKGLSDSLCKKIWATNPGEFVKEKLLLFWKWFQVLSLPISDSLVSSEMATRGWLRDSARKFGQRIQVSLWKNSFCFFKVISGLTSAYFRFICEQWNGDKELSNSLHKKIWATNSGEFGKEQLLLCWKWFQVLSLPISDSLMITAMATRGSVTATSGK
jgi:hypothetical protein